MVNTMGRFILYFCNKYFKGVNNAITNAYKYS